MRAAVARPEAAQARRAVLAGDEATGVTIMRVVRELDAGHMQLQHNKVTNLRLATSRMDGLVIAPGETFSFNRVVGNCTRRKGYVDGRAARLMTVTVRPGRPNGAAR